MVRISHDTWKSAENMGSVTIRNGLTSHGFLAFCAWIDSRYFGTILQMNLGSNPISKLEVVSALNSFNIAKNQYQSDYVDCAPKYNPKVYLGAVQSVVSGWNYDRQNGQNWGEKSGSWPRLNII